MQIVDFSAHILGLDGQPVMRDGKPVTFRAVSQAALIEVQVAADANMPAGQKADYFRIAMLANADRVEMHVDDVSLLKARIEQVMTPLVVGRARELLDPPVSGDDNAA
jgi:hypothetical protein